MESVSSDEEGNIASHSIRSLLSECGEVLLQLCSKMGGVWLMHCYEFSKVLILSYVVFGAQESHEKHCFKLALKQSNEDLMNGPFTQ